MNSLKRILLSILGEKRYLSLLASSFQLLYKTGRLGSAYQDIYFLKYIVRQGDYCIDIGAHLGYYTIELSRLVSHSGKIFAVEPVSKFGNTLANLLRRRNIGQVQLYRVALGGETTHVEIGIPKVNNMKKFGYARIMQPGSALHYVESEKVKNEQADVLFEDLPRLEFIKCDVEGLEVPVFASMMKTLTKHRPVLLCELADRQERIKLFEMLLPLGYNAYFLENKMLHLLDVYSDKRPISHNHYFIPRLHAERLKNLIRNESIGQKDNRESSF